MRKQVNSHGSNPKLYYRLGIGKVGCIEAGIFASEETAQCLQHSPRISRGGVEKNIKVFCGARLRVVRDGVRADDQVPHPMSI